MNNAQLFQQVTEAHDRLQAVLNSTRDVVIVLDITGQGDPGQPSRRRDVRPGRSRNGCGSITRLTWARLMDSGLLRSMEVDADRPGSRLSAASTTGQMRPVDIAFSFGGDGPPPLRGGHRFASGQRQRPGDRSGGGAARRDPPARAGAVPRGHDQHADPRSSGTVSRHHQQPGDPARRLSDGFRRARRAGAHRSGQWAQAVGPHRVFAAHPPVGGEAGTPGAADCAPARGDPAGRPGVQAHRHGGQDYHGGQPGFWPACRSSWTKRSSAACSAIYWTMRSSTRQPVGGSRSGPRSNRAPTARMRCALWPIAVRASPLRSQEAIFERFQRGAKPQAGSPGRHGHRPDLLPAGRRSPRRAHLGRKPARSGQHFLPYLAGGCGARGLTAIAALEKGEAEMADYVLALDQGTTSSRAIVFDRAGRIVAAAQEEFPQIYPQPGWVEHDPEAIWGTQLGTARQALDRAGLDAGPTGGHRHHQPARDDRRVGPRDRRAAAQRHRVAVPAHRRRLRPAPRRGLGRSDPSQDRTGGRCLLFRHQAGLAARPGARAAGQGRARAGVVWDDRLVPHLAAVGRPAARHRRQQRLADDAVQHPHPGLGRRDPGQAAHPAGDAAPGATVVGGVWPGRCPAVGRGRADWRCSRRPAGSPVWPGLFRARAGQEHLRHRLLPAAQHRHTGGGLAARAADDDRLATGQ